MTNCKKCNKKKCECKSHVGKLVNVTKLSKFPPSLVSLRYPFPDTDMPRTWFRNTEDECWLAINATNHKNMILVTHQDRLLGFLGDIVLYTLDGGDTWNESSLVLSRCQGATNPYALNDYEIASDPNIFFDPKGNAYMNAVSFNLVQDYDEAIVVVRSADGGKSWDRVTEVTRDDGNEHVQDRQTGFADPYRENHLYIAWTDFLTINGPTYPNVTKFQKSTDGGATWSEPLIIDEEFADDGGKAPWNSLIQVVNDKHKSILVFCRVTRDEIGGVDKIVVNKSKDGGNTWKKIELPYDYVYQVARDVENNITIMGYGSQIDVCVNKSRDKIYIVNYDPRFTTNGQSGVTITMSTDFGETWSCPVPVNPKHLDTQAFLPSVAVLKDGTVGVTFYDCRNYNGTGPSLWTDVWLAVFNEDLSKWLGEFRLTNESFDVRQAMRRSGYTGVYGGALFLGDYIKMISHKNKFLTAFPICNPPYGVGLCPVPEDQFRIDEREGVVFPNRQDIVFRKIKVRNHHISKHPVRMHKFRKLACDDSKSHGDKTINNKQIKPKSNDIVPLSISVRNERIVLRQLVQKIKK